MIDTIRYLLKNRRKNESYEDDGGLYLIAGLGNPERRYDGTRHNAGFEAVDLISEAYRISCSGTQHKAATGRGMIGNRKVLLAKPLTYMNLSGEAVSALCSYYKINPATHLIVLSDDIYLDVGRIRIRKKGSAGGHNGLKSIMKHLGSEDFIRIRIGVGNRDAGGDVIHHVLSGVSPGERGIYQEGLSRAAQAAGAIVENGVDYAMNRYNSKPEENKREVHPHAAE